MRAYGRYVGKRFRNHPNLIWVVGGDFTPPPDQRWTVEQVAAGIREEDPIHLMTVHCGPGDSAATLYEGRPWFQLNNVYHYREDLYAACLEQDARLPRWPYFLIETAYEGEHKSTPDRIRRQAYWPLLSGAFGIVTATRRFGTLAAAAFTTAAATGWPRWIRAAPVTWSALRPCFVIAHGGCFDPTATTKWITAGYGTFGKLDYVATARTSDGILALSYLPATSTSNRELTVDLSQLAGPVTAHWFNPTDGSLTPVPGSPFAKSGLRQLKSLGNNGTGANDWLLVLAAAAGTEKRARPGRAFDQPGSIGKRIHQWGLDSRRWGRPPERLTEDLPLWIRITGRLGEV